MPARTGRTPGAQGETVNVSVLDGHEVVYVARSNRLRVGCVGFHAGVRIPAPVASPGTLLQRTRADEDLLAWVASREFAGFTSNTLVDPPALLTQVRAVRGQAPCVLRGGLDVGRSGVSVVLRDRFGEARATVGMTVQSQAWSLGQIVARLVPALHDTTQTLRPLIEADQVDPGRRRGGQSDCR
ncbi:IclR family transcriptional regulator domain-containing protein [Sphaerotilus microaerophilus]|uniref:IclR-ED domain-containing protein n=1 Tax=Sphaerotilus microaerophilus TaxID=2914710 RepID=A0ABM7YMC6_9BURK|nr:IclR family transcriptional regulator C-terminal domain-containing protein [Sphaerotilus sp. FB-5]BDI05614.1 hypothetical protein CATMQ487_25840 [Sphaerotilus sp. FB-5]